MWQWHADHLTKGASQLGQAYPYLVRLVITWNSTAVRWSPSWSPACSRVSSGSSRKPPSEVTSRRTPFPMLDFPKLDFASLLSSLTLDRSQSTKLVVLSPLGGATSAKTLEPNTLARYGAQAPRTSCEPNHWTCHLCLLRKSHCTCSTMLLSKSQIQKRPNSTFEAVGYSDNSTPFRKTSPLPILVNYGPPNNNKYLEYVIGGIIGWSAYEIDWSYSTPRNLSKRRWPLAGTLSCWKICVFERYFRENQL